MYLSSFSVHGLTESNFPVEKNRERKRISEQWFNKTWTAPQDFPADTTMKFHLSVD